LKSNSLDVWNDRYLHYLAVEKGLSRNTLESYARDLQGFLAFLAAKDGSDPRKISPEQIIFYFKKIRTGGLSPRSLGRNVSSLKGFFRFLLQEGALDENPLRRFRTPKVIPRLPEVLSKEDIEKILNQPKPADPTGARDRAMFELLYASGLRVSELVGLSVNDVNLEVGFVRTKGKGAKERIVPIGRAAIETLKDYVEGPRRRAALKASRQTLFLGPG
jgi:integrase/recombinase XerD